MAIKQVPVIDAAEATQSINYTEADGGLNQLVEVAGSRMVLGEYGVGNLLRGTTAAHYELRNLTARSHPLPHFRLGPANTEPDREIVGTWDQVIGIHNGHNQAVNLQVIGTMHFLGSEARFGPALLDVDLPPDARFVLAPEPPSGLVEASASRQIIYLPELRIPFSNLILNFTARVAPTSGSISYTVIQRF